MKFTVNDLVMMQEAMQQLAALEPPAAVSFQIARALKPFDEELRNYNKERVKLIRRIGMQDGQLIGTPENFRQFNEEHQALLDVELDLEIKKLKPDILTSSVCPECKAEITAGVNVKPSILLALWFLFEEEAK